MLLEVLEAESQLTAQTALVDLQGILSHRDSISQQISALEVGRLKMVQAYLNEQGMEPDSNLEAISQRAPEDQGQLLKSLKVQLVELIDPIRTLAQLNAERAQAKSNCFTEVYASLHRARKRTSTYSQYGQMQLPTGAVYLTRSI